jgi:hypothetical protein
VIFFTTEDTESTEDAELLEQKQTKGTKGRPVELKVERDQVVALADFWMSKSRVRNTSVFARLRGS